MMTIRASSRYMHQRYENILVPLDGSEAAELALWDAFALAGLDQADVTLLQVVPPIKDVISATSSYRIFVDEQWETRKGQAWGYLQAVCGRMGCAFPRKDGRCSLTKSLGHVKLWAGP
jgi:hypothetical protein